jgi:hypothetical protein
MSRGNALGTASRSEPDTAGPSRTHNKPPLAPFMLTRDGFRRWWQVMDPNHRRRSRRFYSSTHRGMVAFTGRSVVPGQGAGGWGSSWSAVLIGGWSPSREDPLSLVKAPEGGDLLGQISAARALTCRYVRRSWISPAILRAVRCGLRTLPVFVTGLVSIASSAARTQAGLPGSRMPLSATRTGPLQHRDAHPESACRAPAYT